MLNISPNSIDDRLDQNAYESLKKVEKKRSGKVFMRLVYLLGAVFLISLFLPWTQNIRSAGVVTTLKPNQRPQTVHSVIGGRIEEWFVMEGDFVSKGDTILFISEIKDKYFDPDLLQRTDEQLKSNEQSANSYEDKVGALENQIEALLETSKLKAQQARNMYRQAKLKITTDSTTFQAKQLNYQVAKKQFDRMVELHNQGLKSLTILENRRLKMQKASAEAVDSENKLLISQNELINAKVELSSVQAQFRDKIAKSESEKFTAMSNMYNAHVKVTKLKNSYMNYSVRSGLYYITASQDGYITKAFQFGIGEIIKEGTEIVSIMPADYELAVEMYVDPVNLPLVKKGEQVNIQFDGWPAIVFSGWPNISQGTYSGRVYAIDNFISDNGQYRVLVQPDKLEHEWPEALRVGGGTSSLLLLKNVPIWYELWRNFNGFPPDFYQTKTK